MVEASSSASAKGISTPIHGAMSHTKPARMKAVTITPAVASTMPGPMTGLISSKLVSMPPVKRMTHRAIMPRNCVMSADR